LSISVSKRSQEQQMKVLVLGGTGLISTAIVAQLVERQVEVHVWNRGLSEDRLPGNVVRRVADRREIASHTAELRRAKFDCIIDMCGYSAEDAAGLVDAAGNNTPQVIFCSSTDVFSQAKRDGAYPLTEASPRGAPATFPYAVGKVASEETLERAARRGLFAVTIIRPAEVYGAANPNYGPIHPLWHRDYNLWRLKSDLPIILHGDGVSLWCACYAPDVATAFVNGIGNVKALNRDYNIAAPEWVTWMRYWQTVANVFDCPAPSFVTIPSELLGVVFGTEALYLRENFRFNNVHNCARAMEELGFSYRTDLQSGFALMAQHYGRKWLKNGEMEADNEYAGRYESVLEGWVRTSERDPLSIGGA
jgi:nucleoside-diphosphate-sugar epimerase